MTLQFVRTGGISRFVILQHDAHHGAADAGRKHAEAHHIRQGIDLNSEFLFHLRAVLLAPGHLSVEGITQSADQQKEHAYEGMGMAVQGNHNSRPGRNQGQVCQPHRIIVKSNHFLKLLFLPIKYPASTISALVIMHT